MQGRWSAGFVATLCALGVYAAPAAALDAVPRQVIVQFEPDSGRAERVDAQAEAGTRNLEGLGSPGTKLVEITDGGSIDRTIRELEADPAVVRAEPNLIEQPAAIPNDPRFGELWGLHNAGQTVNGGIGIADADIDAPEAWDIERGSANTVVAIMDSGADLTHPDLAPRLWQNPGEIPSNGVDDDGNGFVDDFNGYDFVGTGAGDPNPFDATGHGTHVAGTAAAAGDDGLGVTGVSQRASIMVLRVCRVTGCAQSDTIEAINYAGKAGAHVLNGSLGGYSTNENTVRRSAIFSHPGTLYVWAAGNEAADADNAPAECGGASPCRDYPCAHAPLPGESDNTLCVAATTQSDTRAGFSNVGATSVDLGAPGVSVLSSSAERQYLTETFATNPFPVRWSANGADTAWEWTNQAPLTSNGITDTIANPYAVSTNYGVISAPIAVGAVSERGCTLTFRRAIDLGAGDTFRVALLHGATPVAEAVYDSTDNTAPGALPFQALRFSPPVGAGDLRIRFRLLSNGSGVANGVHVDNVSLECGETPGPHDHDFKSGTSMAAPHVAGAAGLLRSRNLELTTSELRDLLLSSVDPKSALAGVTVSGGRLNVGTAISRTPPTTAITGGPGEGEEVGASARRGIVGTPGARPDFAFSSSDPGAGFECAVDAEAFRRCPNPYETAPLGPGSHSLAVRAVDQRGNADTTPVSRGFSVESDPPETRITKGPKKRTKSRKAKIKFTADEPGSTFECKFDRKRFAPCSSPRKLKKVKPKRHKFLVRATDPVGNVDASPAKKRWQVKKRKRR